MTTPGTPVSLGNGTAVSDRFLIFVGFPDETADSDNAVSRIFYLNLDSETRFTFQDWDGETVVSACLRRPRRDIVRAGCFLSEAGRVEILNSSEHLSEDVDRRETPYGSMRSIQEIGEHLFACGFGGQVYKRSEHGWEAIDGGTRDEAERLMRQELGVGEFSGQDEMDILARVRLRKQRSHEFTRIDGLAEDEVYVCGLHGAIGFHDGAHLKTLSSPTNSHLLDMHCVRDGRIIVAGYHETLLVGDAQAGFSILHEADTEIRFYSVREFRGEIYVGTTAGLRKFNGRSFDVIVDAAAGFNASTVIQQIDNVSDDYLWIVGDRHVFRYDGARVERFGLPDNGG